MSRQPGEGAYAHIEREQRWRAAVVPAGAELLATIEDRYIIGTRLRLRRATRADGVDLKLGQKVPTQPASDSVKLTNIYLSSGEYDVLATLPAHQLTKHRHRLEIDGRVFAIDEFDGRWRGLVLSETELTPGADRLPPPPFAVADVTDDARFTGGALASVSAVEAGALLGLD